MQNTPMTVRISPKVERAQRFAARAHANQKYGDEFPYFAHLIMAFSVAIWFGITDEDILCAVLLHDVLEDTDRTYEEIEGLFGARVAGLVQTVTDPKEGTRKEKHAISYPKIAANRDAVIVKLCDRISHVQFGGKKVRMYVKEQLEFKAALKSGESNSLADNMWNHLDTILSEI